MCTQYIFEFKFNYSGLVIGTAFLGTWFARLINGAIYPKTNKKLINKNDNFFFPLENDCAKHQNKSHSVMLFNTTNKCKSIFRAVHYTKHAYTI